MLREEVDLESCITYETDLEFPTPESASTAGSITFRCPNISQTGNPPAYPERANDDLVPT